MLRERMMGEKVLRLGGLDRGTTEMTLTLEPRSNLKVTLSSVHLFKYLYLVSRHIRCCSLCLLFLCFVRL